LDVSGDSESDSVGKKFDSLRNEPKKFRSNRVDANAIFDSTDSDSEDRQVESSGKKIVRPKKSGLLNSTLDRYCEFGNWLSDGKTGNSELLWERNHGKKDLFRILKGLKVYRNVSLDCLLISEKERQEKLRVVKIEEGAQPQPKKLPTFGNNSGITGSKAPGAQDSDPKTAKIEATAPGMLSGLFPGKSNLTKTSSTDKNLNKNSPNDSGTEKSEPASKLGFGFPKAAKIGEVPAKGMFGGISDTSENKKDKPLGGPVGGLFGKKADGDASQGLFGKGLTKESSGMLGLGADAKDSKNDMPGQSVSKDGDKKPVLGGEKSQGSGIGGSLFGGTAKDDGQKLTGGLSPKKDDTSSNQALVPGGADEKKG
jgi:hypothetical protein